MALTAATGQNIGKIYPAMQSGTATLTAGVVVVAYPRAFQKIPNVFAVALGASGATAISTIVPSGISATQASFTGYEMQAIGAGTLCGTVSACDIFWMAHVDN